MVLRWQSLDVGTCIEDKTSCQNHKKDRAAKLIEIFWAATATGRAGQAWGGSFRGKQTISQRKNLPIEWAQGDQPARCPNPVFCVHQPSAVPSAGGVFVVAGCVSVVCRWWPCRCNVL